MLGSDLDEFFLRRTFCTLLIVGIALYLITVIGRLTLLQFLVMDEDGILEFYWGEHHIRGVYGLRRHHVANLIFCAC